MYSNNDFRSYSENHLEHSWGTKPAQKAREKEYNAWYYATHPEKWGVKNALENLEDKVDDKVSDALDKGLLGKTDLDNKLYNAGKSAYSRMKSKTEQAIVNTGKKNLTSSAMKLEQARRNFEAVKNNPRATASQQRAAGRVYLRAQNEYNATTRGRAERAIDSMADKAARTAGNIRSGAQQLQSDARYKTTTAKRDARVKADVTGRNIQRGANSAAERLQNTAQQLQSDARYKTTTAARNARVNADLAGRNLRRNVDSAVDSVKDRINTAVRNSNTKIDDNLLGAARALKNRDTTAAKNHLSNVGREIANTPGNIKNRVNEAIDNSNTKVDDRLRSAYGAARSGNRAATGMYLRSAGKAAVSETKDAINRRIDNSETTADDNLRRAYRSAREGNAGEARYYARSAASELGRDAKDLARNAAGAVYEGGRRVAGAAEKAVREGYGRLTNDRYDERNYTEGAQRRESNQGPNYNPREVGSDATLNERRQDEYNSRSINPQTGRLNRTATVNTNTERDNGDLTPIQKNRRQIEPEAPRRSLAGQNEMVTDSGTRSRYQKQRESNAGRNEERSDSGTRSSYNQSTYNREKDRGTLAGRNENTSDSGTRSSRTKDTEQRYNNYMGMFEQLAVDSAGASNSAASRGVQAASSAIRKYADAVEMYGSDSRQAQRAYQEAMAEVMDEVRANNRAYDSNRVLPNNGNLNSKSNLDYMKRSKRERERNRIWNG